MLTRGHADVENAGFIRGDSALAIILLTDEEDCSFADAELANPASAIYPGDLNLRCFSYSSAVHPIQRYVDGYLAQRPNPDLFIFAAIAGVPPDLVSDTDAISYDVILADPRMQEMPDPTMPTRLTPSCNVVGTGIAFPPRRIVRVAQELDMRGASAVVQSICQRSYAAALDLIIEKIANALGGACLPRDLNPNAAGIVNCDVVEVLPTTGDILSCDQVPGRVSIGVDPDTGGALCRVTQLSPDSNGDGVGDMIPGGEGWYYDNFTADTLMPTNCGADGQRISFTVPPVTGTEVRLECLQPAGSGGTGGIADVGTPCVPDGAGGPSCEENGAIGDQRCARRLACDPVSRTFLTPCGSDAECTEADLAGYRCAVTLDPPRPFCINPTCGS
jgi:hypothetical protein